MHGLEQGIDRSRGTPPSEGGVKRKRDSQIWILDLSKTISRKRCKIAGKLVLITNRKSHVYELSIGTKIGDLE